jgi:hypothetical protein
MALFQKGVASEATKELTKEQTMEIYGLFKSGLDHTQMFTQNGISFASSEQVFAEIKRVEAEVQSKMIEGTIKDQASLVESIKSFLDAKTLIDDILIYNPSYDISRTWEMFIESFKAPEGI